MAAAAAARSIGTASKRDASPTPPAGVCVPRLRASRAASRRRGRAPRATHRARVARGGGRGALDRVCSPSSVQADGPPPGCDAPACVLRYDDDLRRRLTANIAAHERVGLPLDGRRAAAVAIVVVDSDPERHDVEPLVRRGLDLSKVPGAVDADGRPLDGRMVGVAGGASFLLCRRASRLDRHAGQWALPGGRIDADESALDAALRELDEELGLSLPESSVVGWLDDYATRSGYRISPVVLWGGADPPLAPAPEEVLAVYRIGLHALLAAEPRLVAVPESERPVLQVPLGNDLIHAPTGALLLQLREVALLGRAGARVDQYDEPVFAWS